MTPAKNRTWERGRGKGTFPVAESSESASVENRGFSKSPEFMKGEFDSEASWRGDYIAKRRNPPERANDFARVQKSKPD
ncbi:MAG: hypothetical protein A3C06_03705 [Candidatus Taylorbacteria bacterium RIFCSPHIGHO2_02_FULL_46_13]|uniref:Uncharacterized protein n=1 Tax=Candidatus Taylorbacteria bacterium RIFCSPHIGHO2_02_FULL_46_13 TaxID=1802312 RepID=A0A1G2MT41_9BACT|nr:MAG: hypothetical protein A3C06_03705 [Candidatus Taylorbacteria bacterium RIFCSPHIGHO2_02_FULL_46_13]